MSFYRLKFRILENKNSLNLLKDLGSIVEQANNFTV